MSMSRTRGGRPRAGSIPVTVRMPPAALAALDEFIASQVDPKPSRPEAIRLAVTTWLASFGYLDAPSRR